MKTKIIYLIFVCFLYVSCTENKDSADKIQSLPEIFPDYRNVTIPVNIAPLNFKMDSCESIIAYFKGPKSGFEVKGRNEIIISTKKWTTLLAESANDSITVEVSVQKGKLWKEYLPFQLFVKGDKIDEYLVYRRIAPGYQKWSKMGIYQRNLTNYDESAIANSDMLPGTCMNCHSFANGDPKTMMVHFRMANNGTVLIRDGKVEKLNTKTDQTISNCVYPYWHPSGNYIAYSVNKTAQMFHSESDKRIEVFDSESDIVIYDVNQNELFTNAAISTKENFEVTPSFSADGKKLFFCSSKARKMPDEYDQVKYSLCVTDFDIDSAKISNKVDTLVSAYKTGKSVSFPRISPDGKLLLFSLSAYGYFHIWHKDADLYLMNLSDTTYFPVTGLNSNDADSYHYWSSNGRWIVTASRRMDGLYSHPYMCYVDKNGKSGKAFMLPQKSPDFYREFMYSFNVPEFVKSKVETDSYEIEKVIKGKAKQVIFKN